MAPKMRLYLIGILSLGYLSVGCLPTRLVLFETD